MSINVDAAFEALDNEARRDLIGRLAYGPATTSALVEPPQMTRAGVVTQHLQHLEVAERVLSESAVAPGRTG